VVEAITNFKKSKGGGERIKEVGEGMPSRKVGKGGGKRGEWLVN
jgi:hypothetical protein